MFLDFWLLSAMSVQRRGRLRLIAPVWL